MRSTATAIFFILFVVALAKEAVPDAEAPGEAWHDKMLMTEFNEGEPTAMEQPSQVQAEQAALEGEAEDLGEEEEVESWSAADVQVAGMLLGSVVFVMSLFCLVNWHDDDIRRYTWIILSSTVAIFTAVLVFQGFNQVIITALAGYSEETIILVNFLHFFAYLAIMQLTVAMLSGSIFEDKTVNLEEQEWVVAESLMAECGQVVDESAVRNKHAKKSVTTLYGMEVSVQKRPVEKEKRQRWMRCYATLFAEMAGFAAINAGGCLQHLEYFSSSPYMACIPIILVTFLIWCVFQVLKLMRQKGRQDAIDAGGRGIRAQMYDEEVSEAENDILSLVISFLFTQVIRFSLIGKLPNDEGLEEPEYPHPDGVIFQIYAIGLLLGGLSALFIVLLSKEAKKQGEEEEETPESRFLVVMLASSSMCFAWCILWGTRYVLVRLSYFNMESIMGRVLLAMILSGASCGTVFLLDTIDDSSRKVGSRTGSRAAQAVVRALGILVGFSWEHCFDGSVAAVASLTVHPELVKLVLGLTVAAILVPNWRNHILTKAMMLEQLKEEKDHYEEAAEIDLEAGLHQLKAEDDYEDVDSDDNDDGALCFAKR